MRLFARPSLLAYKRRYLRRDAMAALVVTAIAIPESLGFAAIVGLPPVTGLYTALAAPIVFALFASTRRLIIGADSATAALIASGAVLVAQAGTAGYANAIALLTLLVAVILIAMAVFRMGFLADLISRPVMIGFLAGVGVQLVLTRLPAMLGVEASGGLGQQLVQLAQRLPQVNLMTMTISILVVGLIVIVRRSRLPAEIIALVAATGFAAIFHVGSYGVGLVGALPGGLPQLALPMLSDIGVIGTLLPVAVSIAVVIMAQSATVIRSHAGEHDEPVRINQDLAALGLANAASALTHGFAANGSPPRSLAADMAGGKTQLVNIIMALIVGALLLVGSSVFAYMPEAALAAIVAMLGVRLIRFGELGYIWRTHRTEFFVAMVALVVTVVFGVLYGVLAAVVVSLIERLSRQYRPKDDVLLRDGKLSPWAQERLGDCGNCHPDGLLVYSFDSALFFENIHYFTARIQRAVEQAKHPVRYVVVDAGAIDSIDYTAVRELKLLYRRLSADTIQLGFAHVSPNLMRQFDEFAVTDLVGSSNIFGTLSAAIKARPGARRTTVEMIQQLKLKAGTYVVIGGAVLEALHLRGTNEIDVVVSDEVYEAYRHKRGWVEYSQENGKKVLSREGYNIMMSWRGYSFKRLERTAFDYKGVRLMGIDQLIEAKRNLARRKDIEDIALLQRYKHK